MWAVAFHPDGKHLFSGNSDEIRRWRLADGQEVGKQTGMNLNAISVSGNHKWTVCGTENWAASVWDAEIHEKVIDVEGKNKVYAVDASPDSTRFATGTRKGASIWSITSGERLVGPLEHDLYVSGVRFSPNGEHLATACRGGAIRVFDSYNGNKLVAIETSTAALYPITPLAWSNGGQQIFAVSNDKKIKSFNFSTGSQLAESQILNGDNVRSLALAANGNFIAAITNRGISFLDTTTLSRIDPVIEDSEDICSVALSPDGGCIATGRPDGKIIIRDLGGILPNVYGPFRVSICAFMMLAFWISPWHSVSHVDSLH